MKYAETILNYNHHTKMNIAIFSHLENDIL